MSIFTKKILITLLDYKGFFEIIITRFLKRESIVIVLFLCTFFYSFCCDGAHFSYLNEYYNDSYTPSQINNNQQVDNNRVNKNASDDEYVLKKLCNPGQLQELKKDEIEKHLQEIKKTFLNNALWITYLTQTTKQQQEELDALKNRFTRLMNFLNNREAEIEVLKKTIEEQKNQIQFLFNR